MNPDRATAKQKCEKFWTLSRSYSLTGTYFVHRMGDEEPYDGRLSRTVL